jgi:hypothetical protein
LDKVGFDSAIRTSPLQLKDADLIVLPASLPSVGKPAPEKKSSLPQPSVT